MSGSFQFLFVLAFAFLPVVSFAVIARSFLRRLRNPEQLGYAMSMAIENELRKTPIDTPSRSDARLALIVLLVGFGMVVALMFRETL